MTGRRHVLIEQPFVGRANEIGLLDTALEHAAGGHGQIAILVGEPGIGKTRLLREFEEACNGREGVRVRTARCWEGEGTPAYWPWLQIARAEVRERGAGTVAAELGPSAEDVARLVPELAAEHRRTNLFEEAGPFAVQVEHVRFRLFDGVVRLLECSASASTLVLLIDDLHWADVGSIRLLQFVASHIVAMPVLLVATMREPEQTGEDPKAAASRELFAQSGIARVALTGLSPDAITDYVEQVIGERPSTALVERLHARTQGNPFFLREVVHALTGDERSGVAGSPPTIPETVRQAIGRRLQSLSAAHRRILSVASVLGVDFVVEVLMRCLAAAARGADETTSAETNTAVECAIEHGLLTHVDGGRCEFTHALIREVLYDELGPAGRDAWHCVAGEVLEDWYGAESDQHAGEIAFHLVKCSRNAAALERAVRYYRTAGDRALSQFAYEAAVSDYEGALALLPRVVPPQPRLHCELLLALGEGQMRAGATHAAGKSSFAAAAIAHQSDDPELLARAALGFGWLFQFHSVEWERVGYLEEALARLPEGDSTWRAKVMARLALLRGAASRDARVRDLAEQAVAMARRLGDAGTLAFALNVELYWVLWTPGAAERRLDTARELLGLAERVGDRELALQSRAWCAATLLELGDRVGAEREMALFAVDAEALRQPLYRWIRSYWAAMRAMLDGQFGLAERLAEEAAQIGLQVEPTNAESIYVAFLYMLRWYQGRLGELAPMLGYLQQLEDHFRPGFKCGVAFILSEAGDLERARMHFESVAAESFYDLPFDAGFLSALCALTEACQMLGDVKRAADLYDMLCPFAHLNVVMGWAICCTGSVSRLLGLLATTMRRFDDAERHFADAQAMHESMGDRPMIARTQYDRAVMLHARGAPGDVERALTLLETAIATARTMGMSPVLDKAHALRQQIGAQQPDDGRTNPRERQSPTVLETTNLFRRDGDMWTVSFAGRTCQLRDARGLRYLAVLLRHPDRDMHAMELVGLGESDPTVRTVSRGEAGSSIIRAGGGDAGPVLDAEATAQYQHRFSELREALTEAEERNDLGRTSSLREEMAFLTAELACAGRGKRAASHAERARVAVTKGIKAALQRIDAALPALGAHLRATVRTGYFCSYTPDPLARIVWET